MAKISYTSISKMRREHPLRSVGTGRSRGGDQPAVYDISVLLDEDHDGDSKGPLNNTSLISIKMNRKEAERLRTSLGEMLIQYAEDDAIGEK